jgi:predicted PolB exonuclease-like 3'-5' exonuclease
MSATLVLSVETIPDISRIRRLFALDATLSDNEVAEYAFQRQRAQNGNDHLPFHLQQIQVVSCVLRTSERLEVFSFVGEEAGLLQAVCDTIKRCEPQIVAWGALACIHPLFLCRGMLLNIDGGIHWSPVEKALAPCSGSAEALQTEACLFDLEQQLGSRPASSMPSQLPVLAQLMGYPVQSEPEAAHAWRLCAEGHAMDLQITCEHRALTTYLIFLRMLQAQGQLDSQSRIAEEGFLRQQLAQMTIPGATRFLQDWRP